MLQWIFIGLTILFTVLGQLVLKFGESTLYWPKSFSGVEVLRLIGYSLTNWYVILSMILTLVAALMWLLVVQIMPLSKAYPFMSLNYVLIYILSLFLFGERLTMSSSLGIAFIVIGTLLMGFGFSK